MGKRVAGIREERPQASRGRGLAGDGEGVSVEKVKKERRDTGENSRK